MGKYVKRLVEEEIAKRLEGVSEFVVVNMKGIDGNTNNLMRGELKKKGVRITVVKNSLAMKVFDKLGFTAAGSLFAGPCSLAFGGDSVVDVAKEMVDWSKKTKVLELKGAFLDGEVLDADGAVALSKMPNRVELQGSIIMLANSPGRRVAGAIAGPAGIIAGCIKAIADKAEDKEAA